MVECGVCFEDYQEGDLELHRQMCVVRLMFRCSLCHEDYANKEGLWNHLDLHEIVDENKEFHYEEIKAKNKLHQCVLCNDQRAYSEGPYWQHVHDVHDGFFLRCSDCGENFRSEQLKHDHAFSNCKARHQTDEEPVPIEIEKMPSDAEQLKLSRDEQSSNRLSEHSRVTLNTANNGYNHVIDKESELPTVNSTTIKDLQPRFACDNCGVTFSSKGVLLRHKSSKNACMRGRMEKCPHCRRVFQIEEYQAHFTLCKKKKKSCELCPLKFTCSASLARHKRRVHRGKRVLNTLNTEKSENVSGKTSRCSDSEILVSSSDSCSSSNVVEDTDISTAKKDITYKTVQRLPGTKCIQCGKECARARYLREHILLRHQPTTCRICGITCEGYGKAHHHKINEHTPKYECAKCLKKFQRIELYKRHSNVCHPVLSDLSSHKSSGELIPKGRSDPKVAAENPLSEAPCTKCSYCGKNESSSVSLAHHILIHHDPASSAKCSHCGIEVSSAAILARHILMHHDPVACDFCGITLSSLSWAQHHMKTKHKQLKFKCPHCTMQFSRRTGLQAHESHCAKKKFPCGFCGTMFEDKMAVNRHKMVVCRAYKRSKEQENKKAEMNLCDQTDSSTVMERISTYLGESDLLQTKCYCCKAEFSSPGSLNHHLKIVHKLTKCDICGITIIGLSGIKHHKDKCHMEQKYECPTCGKKFHRKFNYDTHCFSCVSKSRSNEHSLANLNDGDIMDSDVIDKGSPMVSAAPLNGSSERQPLDGHIANQPCTCNICGITLKGNDQISYHMEKTHTAGTLQCPQRDANIEGADCTMSTKQHDDSQLTAEELALYHSVMKTLTVIIPQDENIELELEIKVEETMLQEQDYQVPNEDPGSSSATALHPHGGKSKDVEAKVAVDFENGIKFKEECLEDEEQIITEHQTTTESSECHDVSSYRNESLVHHEAVDCLYPCSVCGLTFETKRNMSYHKFTCHKEPRYKCIKCEKTFVSAKFQRRHENCYSKLRCKTCCTKFNTRALLNKHTINQHPHDGKSSKDAEAGHAEDLANGI